MFGDGRTLPQIGFKYQHVPSPRRTYAVMSDTDAGPMIDSLNRTLLIGAGVAVAVWYFFLRK